MNLVEVQYSYHSGHIAQPTCKALYMYYYDSSNVGSYVIALLLCMYVAIGFPDRETLVLTTKPTSSIKLLLNLKGFMVWHTAQFAKQMG